MRVKNSLAFFIVFRMFSALLVRTYFVPDEYWQSLEVAHRSVFGYGYLTWEWRKHIRSYLYPTIFSVLYRILDTFGLSRSYFWMTTGPKLLQAVISGIGDYGLYSASKSAFGVRVAKWTVILQLTSWLVFFMAPRTLANTMEMALLQIGLQYYPWREPERLSAGYMVVAAISFCIRPTSAFLWLPFLVHHFLKSHRKADIFGTAVFIGFIVVGASTALDILMSGEVVVTPWRFLKFNLVEGISAFYGSHSWHWYFLIGFPTALGLHILPFVFSLVQAFWKPHLPSDKWPVLASVGLYVLVHSFIPHKEHRFLAPVVPLANMLGGLWLGESLDLRKPKVDVPKRSAWIVVGLMLTNYPVALFLGMMHQNAPVKVMQFLHDDLGDGPKLENSGVLFLTPCHATPFYSHLLRNVPMHFLTCEPQFTPSETTKDTDHRRHHPHDHEPPPFDEAERFFADPAAAVELYPVEKFSHVVIFDQALDIIGMKHFSGKGFSVCGRFFNTFFPDGRRGRELYVLCRA